MMRAKDYDKLPIGSVVGHPNTSNMCAYRRVADGTGWAVTSPTAPYESAYHDRLGGGAANLGDDGRVYLIERGPEPEKRPSKKDRLIAELSADVDETRAALDRMTTEYQAKVQENVELISCLEASRRYVAELERDNTALRAAMSVAYEALEQAL